MFSRDKNRISRRKPLVGFLLVAILISSGCLGFQQPEPIIEEEINGVESYVTLAAGGYIRTKKETVDALEKAEEKLIELMKNFNYEKQTTI